MSEGRSPIEELGCGGEPSTASLWSRGLPVLVVLVGWQVAAGLASSPLLPAPLAVVTCLWAEAWHGPLLGHLGVTLARAAAGFVLALVLGGALGIAMASWSRLDRWLDPWLQLLLTLPAMVVAILAYVWLGLDEVAALVAVVLAKLPSMAVILRQGGRQRDRDLIEMARMFRFTRRQRLFDVLLPELAPYILAAARSGLSLVWKIVLLVELLGRSDGIGFQLNVWFQLLDITHLLAYALSFMLVMQVLDFTLMRWMDRHVARWQR